MSRKSALPVLEMPAVYEAGELDEGVSVCLRADVELALAQMAATTAEPHSALVASLRKQVSKASAYIGLLESCQDGYYRAEESAQAKAYQQAIAETPND